MPSSKKSETTEQKSPNLIEVIKADFAARKAKQKDKGPSKDRSLLWGKIGFAAGIVSMGAWLIPFAGLVVVIAGLVFNILGLKADKGRWYAVTGLTLSIVAVNLAIIYTAFGLLSAGY